MVWNNNKLIGANRNLAYNKHLFAQHGATPIQRIKIFFVAVIVMGAVRFVVVAIVFFSLLVSSTPVNTPGNNDDDLQQPNSNHIPSNTVQEFSNNPSHPPEDVASTSTSETLHSRVAPQSTRINADSLFQPRPHHWTPQYCRYPYCGFPYRNQEELGQHFSEAHGHSHPIGFGHYCRIPGCGYVLRSRVELAQHVTQVHQDRFQVNQVVIIYICSFFLKKNTTFPGTSSHIQ